LSTRESDEPWTFQEGELPKWADHRAASQTSAFDFGMGIPADTPEPLWPVFGRILLVRLGVAIAFPAALFFGGPFQRNSSLVPLMIKACLVGFIIGLGLYLLTLYLRHRAQQLGPLEADGMPPMPSPLYLLAPPITLPLAVLIARLMSLAFESRFLGVAIVSACCLALFKHFGNRPVAFAQELRLADLSVLPNVRRTYARFDGSPDGRKLASVLLISLLVPSYFSNTLGIVAVVCYCFYEIRMSILPLLKYGELTTVLAALWNQAAAVFSGYLDYNPRDQYHWWPEESMKTRGVVLYALVASLDLAMLTGLVYYCPWEPFATFFVPGFETNFLFVPEYALTDYRWLRAPMELYSRAVPQEAFMACYILAILLYFTVPVAVLFLVYLQPLVKLELMSQQLKRTPQV
jgi:hypothetical protein